ncbi:DUF4234 domain-containing protein [Streptomyces sp. NPDC054796]
MQGRAGKPRNIFLVWLVWPLITLGVYYFVWYYKINREARELDARIEVNPAGALLTQILGWIVIVPPFVSVYRTGQRIGQMQRASGRAETCNPWIGFVLMFVAGLQSLYYQHELNQVWSQYGDPPEGTEVPVK